MTTIGASTMKLRHATQHHILITLWRHWLGWITCESIWISSRLRLSTSRIQRSSPMCHAMRGLCWSSCQACRKLRSYMKGCFAHLYGVILPKHWLFLCTVCSVVKSIHELLIDQGVVFGRSCLVPTSLRQVLLFL